MRKTTFGPYTWLVLEERDGKALLLCEDIIERRPYHDEYTRITWETCALRAYLNGKFLDRFTPEERSRIAMTRNENSDNTWGRTQGKPFNTPGGNPTDDYVFLLGIADVLGYFPNLKPHKYMDSDKWWYEADERLIAKCGGQPSWWWLRSPGLFQNYAAFVGSDGYVSLSGRSVRDAGGGVRPALWLNLESGISKSEPCKTCSKFDSDPAWCDGRPAGDEAACGAKIIDEN